MQRGGDIQKRALSSNSHLNEALQNVVGRVASVRVEHVCVLDACTSWVSNKHKHKPQCRA